METKSMKKYLPLVSVFSEDSICVWMILDSDGKDLYITNESPIQYLPHDFENKEQIEGMDAPSNFLEDSTCANGWDDWFDFRGDFIQFAIENGIAPWQPFLIRFYKPIGYFISTDIGDEWDAEFEWDIVTVEKWQPSRIAAAWRLFFSERSM